MTDQELVKKCLVRICRKSGFEPAGMIQRDFDVLTGEIEDKTGILISVSTVKRLLHGEFSRLPQAATLNAISSYLGYKNWHEYRSSEINNNNEPPVALSPERQISKRVYLRGWKIAAAVTLVAAAIAVAGFLTASSKPGNFEKATFSARKTISNGIPNTVVFNYNIDEVEGDSFFIQQSWDVSRRVRIYKKNYTLTDIYYEPGYHMAKLMANDKVIKTFDMSIPTGDWFFYAKTPAIPRSTPVYIKPVQPPAHNGVFSLTKEDLSANQLDWQNEKQYIYSIFPEKQEVSADNYVFKARVRVREVRNNFCPTLMCEVFCQRNFMFFKSTSPGCTSEAMIEFGDDFKHGKQYDLSFLGKDVTKWIDVEIRVQDKQATVLMDRQKVYSTTYNASSGLITGLGFISNGLCEVDYAELKGLDGKTVYANDFN